MVYGTIFPNAAINVFPTNLQFVLFEPLAPARSIMHMWYYFVGESSTSAACRAARETVYEEWVNLNVEDEGVCRRLQQGRGCDAYDGGRLAPYWDTGTIHLHRQVADAVCGRGLFAGPTATARSRDGHRQSEQHRSR